MKSKTYQVALVYVTLLVLCSACLLSAGCSKPKANISSKPAISSDLVTRDKDPNSAVDSIDDKQATLTFPETYFGDAGESSITAQLKDKGATDVTHNADNTYTATFPRIAYDTFIGEIKGSVTRLLDSMASNGTWASIKKVTYDNNFATITITVNGAAYASSLDSQAIYSAGVQAGLYQEIAGLPVGSTVTIIDEDGTTLVSGSFPDMLAEVGSDA